MFFLVLLFARIGVSNLHSDYLQTLIIAFYELKKYKIMLTLTYQIVYTLAAIAKLKIN